jgi:hypothetical protein
MTAEKRPPDDVDRQLARLLAEHHAFEDSDLREHMRRCSCCSSVSLMIAALRRDMWDIAERRRP